MDKDQSRFWFLLSGQLFLFLSVLILPLTLRAEEGQALSPNSSYDLFYTKALQHINQKKFSEAIVELKTALSLRPEDVEASYYLGVALSKTGKDKEAEELLKKVVALDPKFEKVHFDLGVVKYNLGKYPEALQQLDLAEKAEPNNGMIYYYQGLTFHHMGDYERSSPRFLRAVSLAPELGLTAHYYAGVGFYRRGVLEEARDELQEAIRLDPASQVAKSAEEFLAQLPGSKKKTKRWDLNISAAYQYDSNVILLPGGSTLPAGISRKGDNRLVFYFRGGYRFLETSNWTVGGAYAFYQSLHDKLRSFDVQSQEASAFLLYRQPWGELRIPYTFNYALVNEDVFLRSHAVTPAFTLREASITYTQIQYGYTWNSFVNTPQFSNNSDRDGINHMAAMTQSLLFAQSGLVRLGYAYDTNLTGSSPAQDDWAYLGHKITADLRLPTLQGFKLDVEADYYIQQYEYPNSYASPVDSEKRMDHIQTYSTTLSKTFGKWVTLSLQYMFNRNDSNIPVFKYDRSIVSVILAGNF